MRKSRDMSVDHDTIQRTAAARDDSGFDSFSENQASLDDLKPYIEKLPEREQDLIYMYYGLRKKQKEIAAFFKISQGAVSHRLTRARARLMFLRDMPKVPDEVLLRVIGNVFDQLDCRIIYNMVKTTCQSVTASIVASELSITSPKLTQVRVRHRYLKALKQMKELADSGTDHEVRVVYELMECIRGNGYMLHEVKLPHFDRGKEVFYGDDDH